MVTAVWVLILFVASLPITLICLPLYPQLKPEAFSPETAPSLVGVLAPNLTLDQVIVIGEEQMLGPECALYFEGAIYAGTRDGKLVRLKNSTIETVLDWQCNYRKGVTNKCSRLMGLRGDNKTGDIYVADSVKGIYKFNIYSGNITVIFDSKKPINGKLSLLIDDLTLAENGDLYFTDASTRWREDEMFLDFVESSANGRILHFNAQSKKTAVILDNLYFPNGIQISQEQDFFIFSETSRYRIRQYFLKGPKKGQLATFTSNVPGFPDNIRFSPRGTYWVALAKSRLAEYPSLLDYVSSYPFLRGFGIRFLYAIAAPLSLLDGLGFTDHALSSANQQIHDFLGRKMPRYGLILEINANGNIIRSFHSASGKAGDISSVIEHEGVLFMGSPWRRGIQRITLPS